MDDKSVFLADQAFDAIRKILRDNIIKSGQLISIPFISELIGFPLAPVREAVQKASALGLMRSIPKRGILIVEGDKKHVTECLVIRHIWDAEGARILTKSPDLSIIEPLIKKHELILEKAGEGEIRLDLQQQATQVDWEMHELLCSRINNTEINKLYAINRDRLTIMYNTKPIHPVRLAPAFNEHISILLAIMEKDESKVLGLLDYHYQQIFKWLDM
ncbi:MAG: FCD domain-containing protein [Candidatus Oceanisphaera merdipullorum]|nr:FCD domain-containing protein [Candidatus Oceanisphaera merdipullorum]